MVKMFGWEQKISERVAEKRDEELKPYRSRELASLLNQVIKCVFETDKLQPKLIDASSVIPILVMIVTYATFVSPFSQFMVYLIYIGL
jgi:hypothetical protein